MGPSWCYDESSHPLGKDSHSYRRKTRIANASSAQERAGGRILHPSQQPDNC